jgi:hypothetical protein
MAQAQFHKNQRVYVKPVGTWALVERVVPHWTKGLDVPLRIYYDVGLGREFAADELQAYAELERRTDDDIEEWRVVRGRNKWQSAEETKHHPFPGTHPVVVTGDIEGGGWRVPGGEYALSPVRLESQARMMAATPRLAKIVRSLREWSQQSPGAVPESLGGLMKQCDEVLRYLDSGSE